jgi:hypothetical protein
MASLFGMGVACGTRGPSVPHARPSTEGLPRVPEGSPDLDLINTLLQLEHRVTALSAEAAQRRRLGPRAAQIVDRIIQDHMAHVAALEQLVQGVGSTPDPARHRYSLPTPLGDERRALGIVLEDEVNLVSKYSAAVAGVYTTRLARPLGSLLFSVKTHVAALERLLDRCGQPSFAFEAADPAVSEARPPASVHPQGPLSGTVAADVVLRGLSSMEAAAARVCSLAASEVSAAFERVRQMESGRDRAGTTPSPSATLSRVEISGYCLVLRDAEGRVVVPESGDAPTALSVLEGRLDLGGNAQTVVSSVVSLLDAMSSAHSERATFWSSSGEAVSAGAVVGEPGATPSVTTSLPDELSPTAAGISEDRLGGGESEKKPAAEEVFSVVQDTEVKTATALAVAASNLADKVLRTRIGEALASVATATSRLAGLATGDTFLVAEI